MHQLIQHDDIVAVHQRADGAGGRRVTGRERQGGGGAFEIRQDFVQLVMGAEGSADQARGPRPGPEFPDGLDGRLFKRGFIGQAQIIVGRKVKKRPAVDGQARRLRRIHAPQFAKQILLAKIGQT